MTSITPSHKIKYLSWVPGQYFGGCEDYALRIALKAHELGWDVTVICEYKKCYEVFKLKAQGIKVVLSTRYSIVIKMKILHTWLRTFILQYTYLSLLKEYKPDVVHAILPWHNHSVIFLLACDRAKIPCLVTFQLVGPGSPPPPSNIRIFHKVAKNQTKLCAISLNNRFLLHKYYNLSEDDIACIPNRPRKSSTIKSSSEFCMQFRRKLGCTPENIAILTVGSLIHRKGYDLLINGIPRIVQKYPTTRFFFAGDGEDRQIFERLANDLGVSKYVNFLGNRNDVPKLLMSMDYFLFPTRFEGGESFALLEAASSGLPIVASKASGVTETFRDGIDALLFDVDDVDGLVSRMLEALNDPTRAKSRAASAIQRVAEYDEDFMLKDTFALLQKQAEHI
jgi:glycosyltransferase involved in cell wall biosynthesis